MAINPISDPIRHLSAMTAQLVSEHRALAGHIDRLVDGLGNLSKDMRVGFRANDAKAEAIRAEMNKQFDGLRAEMNDRFRAVGSRFDDVEERLLRFEDNMRELHSDLLRMQNDVLNAQQSALQAHLRLDDHSPGGRGAACMTARLDARFARCRAENRAALVTYVMAGDPAPDTSLAVLRALPRAGADIVEFGLPFTDPMADGPAIQAAALRALKAGQTTAGTLDLVRRFRAEDAETPVILMGYFNPIYVYGVERFLSEAKDAGVDGLIVVDLPPEEDEELCLPALRAGLAFIRLATPTTDDRRLPAVLANTAGFVYYVSITGITGAATPDFGRVSAAVERIKRHTPLPVVVGFGVKAPEHAAAVAQGADGVVVGSALIDALRATLDSGGQATPQTVEAVAALVRGLAEGVRSVRKAEAA